VASPVDRLSIGGFGNIDVIPNGVDLAARRLPEGHQEPNTIAFSGRMAYFPNADAARWFAREIFPLVRQQSPEARFRIIGADPPHSVRRLGRIAGVEVTGYVDCVQQQLARATVAVCPMRVGSGIQNKVLEAMASGVPVVATPVALGGIEAAHGGHLLVGQRAEDVAEQVVILLKDAVLRKRLAVNARSLVEEKYTWENAVAALEAVYRTVTSPGQKVA
jgi:glycosyltransferase involved in cell wall biosynthesis